MAGEKVFFRSFVFLTLSISHTKKNPNLFFLSTRIGIIKKGATGGMLTGLLFQVPGLVIMTLVGVGAASFLKSPAPWLRGATAGLGAAGVALVAASAFALTRGACKGDRLLLALSAASAVVTFYTVKIWLFPVLILAGGLVTLAVNAYHKRDMTAKTTEGGNDEAHVERFGLSRPAGALVGLLWAAVLVASLVAASKVPDYPSAGSSLGLDLWTAMFRAGSMIFGGEFCCFFFFSVGVRVFFSFSYGKKKLNFFSFFSFLKNKQIKTRKNTGGQVVIPLLYKDVVQRDCDTSVTPPQCVDSADTWVSSSDFYLGLSVVQGEEFFFSRFFFFSLFCRFLPLFLSHTYFSQPKQNFPSSAWPALQLRPLPRRRRRRWLRGQIRQPQRSPRRLYWLARPQRAGHPALLQPAAVVGRVQALPGVPARSPGAQRRGRRARDVGGAAALDLAQGAEPVPGCHGRDRDDSVRRDGGCQNSRAARGARGRGPRGGRLGGGDEIKEGKRDLCK